MTGCTGMPVEFHGQSGQVFGMAGLAESGTVKHVLRDRVGDDPGGGPGADVIHCAADRGENRRGAGLVWSARLGADTHSDVDNRQRIPEGGRCCRGLDHCNWQVRGNPPRPHPDKRRIGEKIEGLQPKLRALAPGGKRDVGANASRLTDGQRQGRRHSPYLYSSIAPRRISPEILLGELLIALGNYRFSRSALSGCVLG